MIELIKNYLIENKTIIIPQLGALTLTNEVTLEVMFLSYLKYDDGKLTEIYAAKNNCTLEEAKDSILKWVDKIISDLTNNQEVSISDLGYFFKNKDGEYDFKSGDVSKASSVNELVDSEKEEDSIVENILLSDVVEEKIQDIDTKEASNQDEPEVEMNETTPEIVSEPVEPTVFEPEQEAITIPNNEAEETAEVIIPSTKITPQETTILISSKRKNPLSLVLIILTIFLLIGGIMSVLFYEDIKVFLPFSNTEKIEVKTPVNSDKDKLEKDISEENSSELESNANETTQVKSELDKIELEKQEENIEIIDNSKTSNFENGYYVIVGCFHNELYADRLLNNLKSKGYEAEIIKNSEFNMVSIARFTTLIDAQQKNNEMSNSWIFKK